jgi:hypothetical protein
MIMIGDLKWWLAINDDDVIIVNGYSYSSWKMYAHFGTTFSEINYYHCNFLLFYYCFFFTRTLGLYCNAWWDESSRHNT